MKVLIKQFLVLILSTSIVLMPVTFSNRAQAEEPDEFVPFVPEDNSKIFYYLKLRPVTEYEFKNYGSELAEQGTLRSWLPPDEKDIIGYTYSICALPVAFDEYTKNYLSGRPDTFIGASFSGRTFQEECVDFLFSKDSKKPYIFRIRDMYDHASRAYSSMNADADEARNIELMAFLGILALGLLVLTVADPLIAPLSVAMLFAIGLWLFYKQKKNELYDKLSANNYTNFVVDYRTKELYSDVLNKNRIVMQNQSPALTQEQSVMVLIPEKEKIISYANMMNEYLFNGTETYAQNEWDEQMNELDERVRERWTPVELTVGRDGVVVRSGM